MYPATGLLVDFGDLKRLMRAVVARLDHQFLNDLPPFDAINPSAENIARHIYDRTAAQLPKAPNAAAISSVTVWETETSAATYRE